MKYAGKITDSSGAPIGGSSIAFVNDAGQRIVSMPTNGAGQWGLDDSVDDGLLQPGVFIVFSAPGYYEYSIAAANLPQTFNVKLTKKADTVLPWMIAVVNATALVYKLSETKKGRKVGKLVSKDLYPIFLIIGGVIAFSTIRRILESLGLWQNQELKAIATDPGSFWNPNYWQTINPSNAGWTYALTEDQARGLNDQIKDSFGILNDSPEQVKAVFRSLRTKANASFLAWEFQKTDGSDLFSFLRNGGGIMPWDGLSDKDVLEINSFINSLPNY